MNRIRRFAGVVVETIRETLELSGRARALAELRQMEHRFLREHGFSPELLEEGLAGWPWRLEETGRSEGTLSKAQIRKAVAELRSYNDAELADLGIGRSEISYVVRHGRPGIDNQAA